MADASQHSRAPTGGGKDNGRRAGENAASASSEAAPAADDGERPRWLDHAPPEMVEKLKQMSPEERQAWFRQRRDSGGGSSAPAP